MYVNEVPKNPNFLNGKYSVFSPNHYSRGSGFDRHSNVLGALVLIKSRPRRPPEPGFEYAYIEADGSARELDESEVEYLSTEFHGTDGSRPYIKINYEARTPDGKIHGTFGGDRCRGI